LGSLPVVLVTLWFSACFLLGVTVGHLTDDEWRGVQGHLPFLPTSSIYLLATLSCLGGHNHGMECHGGNLRGASPREQMATGLRVC
jgi:hypothetical protein